ncbi:sigma-54-dependent Fis family transcriptional regulator [Variovorax sp. dw_954]|uniref:sigma-54-dependent Fis family transcriptional regulator n=1 Tax=Variovorax sp. dw_954 TaxID=2720078 RepID=UPI001BD5AEC3|nr:sigma-54-dependent Fis family transcriptional regulator [Variovorax sp. dw_954]
MLEAAGAIRRTQHARELFFNQGLAPTDWVAPHISRSWARSRGAGVWNAGPAPMSSAQLREHRESSRLLIESAQPELDALAEHAIGQGCVVIVTDASGVILDEIGSPEFLPKAQRVALLPGVEWSERQCGTNAIGTVLVERHPLAVLGGEHFLAGNGGLGCAAAPIFNGRGEIAGVLDISGDAVRIDGHTLGLVRMASQQIEHRMMLSRSRGDIIRLHANGALIGSAREGLLYVVDGQVVAANRVALALLGHEWKSVLDQPVERLLGSAWPAAGGHAESVNLPGGARIVMSRQHALARRSVALAGAGSAAHGPHEPARRDIADDDAVSTALRAAVKVLDAGVPVLVTGETGVGKEVFARRLHSASRRRGGPMVVVNCAALPETLIEAELFGYEEGAFTGARRQGAAGRIREAHGGTLMLDEIGDMPLMLQTRLLRVLEDRVVTPLGAGRPVQVEFQLVCATHCDLPALSATGAFRADLMYRINGYALRLPSLRERTDKSLLIRRLFDELGGKAAKLRLQDDAADALARQPWPGNIRELVSVLRIMIALAEPGSVLGVGSVPSNREAGLSTGAAPFEPAVADPVRQVLQLSDVEARAIHAALEAAGGNVARAASSLGLHRSTLYRHLRRFPL